MQMEGMCSFPRGDLLLDGRESFQHSFNFEFTNRGIETKIIKAYEK